MPPTRTRGRQFWAGAVWPLAQSFEAVTRTACPSGLDHIGTHRRRHRPHGRRHTVGQVAAGIAFAILAATTLSVFGIGPRSSRTSVALRLGAALLLLVAALLLLNR
jgi:hypothetical protein